MNSIFILFSLLSLVISIEPIKYEEFINWAVKNGAKMTGIRWPVEFPNTGRGVEAIKAIGEDEVFLKVPMSMVIWVGMVDGTALEDVVKRLGGFEGLILLVMLEKQKGTRSFWHPFFSIIEDEMPSLTLKPKTKKREREIKETQDELIRTTIERNKRAGKRQYQYLLEVLQNHGFKTENLTARLFHWAEMVVSTRCFSLNSSIEYAIVPTGDLFNHNFETGVSWKVSNEFYRLSSSKPISRNSEVYLNYGSFSNMHFLLYYGFVPLGNIHNYEKIKFTSDDEAKTSVFQKSYGLFYIQIRPYLVIEFFRLLTAENSHEISNYRISKSADVERRALQSCVDKFATNLREKPTTTKQDYKLLSKKKNAYFHSSIRYRIEQKKVYSKTLHFCLDTLEMLRCKSSAYVSTLKYPLFLFKTALNVVA